MIEHLKSTLKSVLILSARPEPVLDGWESLTEPIEVDPVRAERDPLTPGLLAEKLPGPRLYAAVASDGTIRYLTEAERCQ